MAVVDGVDCEYRSRCKGMGEKCQSCKHNDARDFYEPAEPYVHWPYPDTGNTKWLGGWPVIIY
ncbi:hypothetical protein LCGC14_1432600 [marine sediment metagenome]|uniref:Uncharacterized protein n=1 Tax=marine sediment metagenome TaxID=412755 RepID=A0A0F9M3J7_9ZZZZ